MCDDLLAHHHRLSASSSIPLSSNPTWFTTQAYGRDATESSPHPRTYLFLPPSFSIDPIKSLLPAASSRTNNSKKAKQKLSSRDNSTNLSETTIFNYFPSFFDINKQWTIYAFDKSVLALYPQKADRCEMLYELVLRRGAGSGAGHGGLYGAVGGNNSSHQLHHSNHHGGYGNNLHPGRSGERGGGGYPRSTPHSRSTSPAPAGAYYSNRDHHTSILSPALNHLAQSYELVEDTEWFRKTFPSRQTLLKEEKCLSIIDIHSHSTSSNSNSTNVNNRPRAGYLLLLLPTSLSTSSTTHNRIYISEIYIFPSYRGGGGVQANSWGYVGKGLLRMLLEAVVDVAGDIAEELGTSSASGVDVWMNLSAEKDLQVVKTAIEMGWEVNRSLWVVERNSIHEELPEEEEDEEEEKTTSTGSVSKAVALSSGEERPALSGAALGELQQKAKGEQVSRQEQGTPSSSPVANSPPAATSPGKHQGKHHWSFGDWGKGMKGWRERWIKALDEISHGNHGNHGNGSGSGSAQGGSK